MIKFYAKIALKDGRGKIEITSEKHASNARKT